MKDSTRQFIMEKKKRFESLENKQYVFFLKHEHMYNYTLVCQIDKNEYSAMCEIAPPCKLAPKGTALLIWLEDFNFPSDELDNVKLALERCLRKNDIKPLFIAGAR